MASSDLSSKPSLDAMNLLQRLTEAASRTGSDGRPDSSSSEADLQALLQLLASANATQGRPGSSGSDGDKKAAAERRESEEKVRALQQELDMLRGMNGACQKKKNQREKERDWMCVPQDVG